MVELAICVMEAVLPKSGTGGSVGGRIGNFCIGSSFAEIECR